MKIVTKLPEKQGLAEIYQSMALRLALLRPTDNQDELERITPFVLCRDFLVDVYTFSKAKLKFKIYGMSFPGDVDAPAYNGVYLLAQFPNKKAKSNFINHLHLLHRIEGMNNIPNTQIAETSALKSVVIGDVRWLKNCLCFSLYTFLLRVLCYDFKSSENWMQEFGKLSTSDSAYAQSVNSSVWERVFADLSCLDTEEFCGFEVKRENTSMIHHNSGFISVFGSHSEINPESVKKNKHWQLMKERGFSLTTE